MNNDATNVTTVRSSLLTYIHSILSFDAESFIRFFIFLLSFVPSFGINISTMFFMKGTLYTFSCQGCSGVVSILVEPLSFNFLVSM